MEPLLSLWIGSLLITLSQNPQPLQTSGTGVYFSMISSVSEIRKICIKQEIYDSAIIRITRKITPYLTWFLLKLGLSANQTTILGMVVGTIGAVLLSFNSSISLFFGICLLHLSNLLDYCDGEIARYHSHFSSVRKYDVSGAYLDWLWHFYIPTTTIFFLSLGIYKLINVPYVFIFGFIAILGFCIFPFSCKEHILIDQIRKYPDIIDNKSFKMAMMDKFQDIDVVSDHKNTSALSFIKRQVSEWVYYPSFFNALTIIVLSDLITDGYRFRYSYIIILAFIITAHQIQKIRQTFLILRSIQYER